MNFLENIRNQNQFPIVFIGSGITKRYFKNAPNWQELLLKIWSEVDSVDSYYSMCYELQKKYGKSNTFDINTELATVL